MRDNLFRGKLTEKFAEAPKMRFDLLERGIVKDGFVYGSLVVDGKRCFICISAFVGNQSYVNNACATMFEVDPETVGQFTGVTDKNGTMIFEGDILHCVSQLDNAKMVVIFECGEYRMVLAEKFNNYIEGFGFYAITCFEKEVIGNIYDNPELLEGL